MIEMHCLVAVRARVSQPLLDRVDGGEVAPVSSLVEMFVTLLAILLLHPGVAVLVLLQARLTSEALATGLALPRAGDPLVYAPNVRLQRVCFLKLLVAGRALQPGRNVVSGDELTDLG